MEQPSDLIKQDELTNGNPRKCIIAGVLIIFFFFGGLGAWAAFFPFGGAVIAPGIVKVSMERKVVQHLEGGIVDKIFVKEGTTVEKGQVLVSLKSSSVDASVSLLNGQLWNKIAELSRYKAESRFADTITWLELLPDVKTEPAVEKIVRQEEEVFRSGRKDLLGKTELYLSQIEQLKQKIIGAQEEMAAQEKIARNIAEELVAKETLYKERYIDKAQLLGLQRSLAEREGQAGALRQVIAETGQKIEEMKLRIIDLRNTYQQSAISELSRVSDQVYELRERLKPNIDQKERLEIKAPLSGEVINLKIHSEDGGVIRPGEPLLEIVPENAKLIIESHVQTQDVTHIQKGQAAKVQLTAFNRRETSPIEGMVTYVSADKLTQQTSAGEIPYYLVHVEVDETSLKESGAYLSPGMPAVCYISTEVRTILGYLMDPILENFDRALRESN